MQGSQPELLNSPFIPALKFSQEAGRRRRERTSECLERLGAWAEAGVQHRPLGPQHREKHFQSRD